MKYVFLNKDNVVVNVILGNLDNSQKQQFLNDYYILFGATSVNEELENTFVYMGGTYDKKNNAYLNPITPSDPVFTIPEQPEPK